MFFGGGGGGENWGGGGMLGKKVETPLLFLGSKFQVVPWAT